MIDVVYQYIDAPKVWEELKYSIRSIEKHFKHPHRIWIIGDLPNWSKGINHIPHIRKNGFDFSKIYDACQKLKSVINHPDISEDFIYMNDDIYLLQDAGLEAFQLYAIEDMDKVKRAPRSKHQRKLWETYDVVKKAGFTGYNGSAHLPFIYNKSILKDIFNRFKPEEKLLLPSTLFVNYPQEREVIMVNKSNNIKAGFYGFNDHSSYGKLKGNELSQLLDRSLFLNHSDEGLTPELKKEIIKRFPSSSTYEV